MNTAPAPLSPIPVLAARPAPSALWRVEVQVLGLALAHRWTGWALDSQQATQRARDEARQLFRGYPLCVRNVLQVGV